MPRHFALLSALLLAACGGNDYYNGPTSDHFDGVTFFNPDRPRKAGFGALLKWRLGLGDGPQRAAWPAHVKSDFPTAKPAERVLGDRLVVTSVGHATFLIQTQGLNILTDPVWSSYASPVSFAGPKRVMDPGIALADLPPIDVIWVSHNHYEHLDLPSIKALWARETEAGRTPRIVVPLGNDTIIQRALPEVKAEAYDWSDEVKLNDAVTAVLEPMHHWSARGLGDRSHALWAALVLKAPGGNIYFVGDSGYGGGTWFKEHGGRYSGFRLSILPIGAYEPRWFMAYAHMNPAEAVAASQDSSSTYSIGHHWGVFQLTDEAREQPLTDLAVALQEKNIPANRFRPLQPGEAWDVPAR